MLSATKIRIYPTPEQAVNPAPRRLRLMKGERSMVNQEKPHGFSRRVAFTKGKSNGAVDADGGVQGGAKRRTREAGDDERVAAGLAGTQADDESATEVEASSREDEVRRLLEKRPRKKPTLAERCASALLTICRPTADGRLAPVVDRDRARTMTAKEIIGCFEFDHVVLHALGGSNHPTNLVPRPIAEHREKSGKDTSIVAKVRRIAPEHEEFRRKMLVKQPDDFVPTDKPTSNKLRGRGFQGSRRFDGSVNWKTQKR